MNPQTVIDSAHAVAWSSICQQIGHCAHVPDTLSSLVSDDESKRERGYWQIDNHLVVQGTLFEGAFYVVPFLIALLKCRPRFGRKEILELLNEISLGQAQSSQCVVFTMRTDPLPFFVPSEKGLSVLLRVGTRNAVAFGITTYLTEVADPNSDARAEALDLLTNFYEHADLLKLRLEEIYAGERHSEFRASLREAMTELDTESPR